MFGKKDKDNDRGSKVEMPRFTYECSYAPCRSVQYGNREDHSKYCPDCGSIMHCIRNH